MAEFSSLRERLREARSAAGSDSVEAHAKRLHELGAIARHVASEHRDRPLSTLFSSLFSAVNANLKAARRAGALDGEGVETLGDQFDSALDAIETGTPVDQLLPAVRDLHSAIERSTGVPEPSSYPSGVGPTGSSEASKQETLSGSSVQREEPSSTQSPPGTRGRDDTCGEAVIAAMQAVGEHCSVDGVPMQTGSGLVAMAPKEAAEAMPNMAPEDMTDEELLEFAENSPWAGDWTEGVCEQAGLDPGTEAFRECRVNYLRDVFQ